MRRPSAREWADYLAGRLGAADRARLERAASDDPAVAADRARAERIRAAMASIAEQPAPELPWDHIGARVHWELSLARRGPARQRLRRGLLLAAGGVLCAAAVLWWLRPSEAIVGLAPAGLAAPEAAVSPAPASPAQAERGLLTMAQGRVVRGAAAVERDDMDRAVSVGERLETAQGRVAVQFGARSAFEIGPRSSVELVRFDDQRIELRVEGTIDVDLSHRRPGQRFLVTASGLEIEVRGTRFRVRSSGSEVAVTCARGRVVARQDGVERAIPAGARLLATATGGVGEVQPIAEDELSQLDLELEVPMLPHWPSWSPGDVHPSAVIAARAEDPRLVAIDGAEVGTAPLFWRVAAGRHHVAFKGRTWSSGRWYRVENHDRLAVYGPKAESPPKGKRSAARRARVVEAIEKSRRVRACASGLRKRGLAEGAFVVLELGVAGDGTHLFVNIVDGDLSAPVRRCVRAAVDQLEFGRGAAVELRHRLVF